MDYTQKDLSFKLKKTFRYIRMYGVRRTLMKIRGQYHTKKEFQAFPKRIDPIPSGGHVGIIGCGNFAFSNIAYYLKKNYGNVIRGAMDTDKNRAASMYKAFSLRYYTNSSEELISDTDINLIYIASNHASHAEYGIEALKAGKSIHIEKPHVVNEDQLIRLCKAMIQFDGQVALGFNRPTSKFGREIKRYLQSENGPIMFNWFIAGHEIDPDNWYFRDEEGGRVLGNLCHWTDFVYQMMPPKNRYPLTIKVTRAEKSDCDVAVNYLFGDGSIATITFSAKGHTFEGVRERFSAHRGDVLIYMEDFHKMIIEVVEKKHFFKSFYRDHGHEQNIRNSFGMVAERNANSARCPVSYVWETGELFLKTKQALEENCEITITPYKDI